jgi:hypothetical protein
MTKLRHDLSESDRLGVSPLNEWPSNVPSPGFDRDGVPLDSPVATWLDLKPPLDTRWLQAVLRFSRADGSVVFEPTGRSLDRLKRLDASATRLGDPSLASIVARWLPRSHSSNLPTSPAPLPSDSRPDRPLAILRGDWSPRTDLLAIDHRQSGLSNLLEVAANGQIFLGPTWSAGFLEGKITRPKPTSWTNGPFAQSLEWSFAVGSTRVTRVVTLLRGRSMAILGQQVEGARTHSEVRLGLSEGIDASFVPGSRALQLKGGPGKPSARLLPLSLPCHDRATDQGSIAIEGREVVIRQAFEGRRSWLPVLLTWDKPPSLWRPLTVAYRSKTTKSDEAVAVRVAWGPRSSGLVVYRSLAKPSLRSFLGHQTSSKYLIGSFTQAGDVSPILKVDG